MAFKEKQLNPVRDRVSNGINEKLLQWVWQNQLLTESGDDHSIGQTSCLFTECGSKLKILSPGILNIEDGPDFRDVRISVGENILEGDIEIHLSSSDWFTHKHQLDPKYNNVLLHVVWHNDSQPAITQDGKSIPTLVISKYITKSFSILLKDYKKAMRAKQVYRCPYVKHNVMRVIEDEGIKRFNDRKQKFSELIKHYGIEQATYIGVMESLGYVKNELPFSRLAKLVQIDKLHSLIVGKTRSKRVKLIKAALLGVADLLSCEHRNQWNKIKGEFSETMKEEEWQFFKVRPSAFPNRRIEKISYFLADTIEQGIFNFFKESFPDLGKIENSFAQAGISKACARTTILNVCLPILASYDSAFGKDNEMATQIYRNYKRLPQNNITKLMSKLLLRNKVGKAEFIPFLTRMPCKEIYYQGMIRIYYRHCQNKQCDTCPIKN